MRAFDSSLGRSRQPSADSPRTRLEVECLESRDLLTAVPALAGTTLTVLGGPNNDLINITRDLATDELVVRDAGRETGRFASGAVNLIVVDAGDGNDTVFIGRDVTQDAQINGGGGNQRFSTGGDLLFYRGSGDATIDGGSGDDRLLSGTGNDTLLGGTGDDLLDANGGFNTLVGGPGRDTFVGVIGTDTVVDLSAEDIPLLAAPPRDLLSDPFLGLPPSPQVILTADEVDLFLQRATAATSTNDAIIAVVDRGGRILGVRVEDGVDPGITGSDFNLVFAIDGAVAKARTGAFFGNNQAPLTSRTIQNLSETTISQREVESIPSITDENSTLRGPGFVAPVGLGNHFPRGVAFTPQVDLFAIEHTNRDSIFAVGFDNVRGAANGTAQGDDIRLPQRFNANPVFIPDRIDTPGMTEDPLGRATVLAPPDSYGVLSGRLPHAQARGIATLPGGIPLYKRDPATGQLVVVGGIGVFFPGKSGFATEENSAMSTTFDPSKLDRSLESEFIAFAAAGGSSAANLSVGPLGGVALPTGPDGQPVFDLPAGRIDLVGLTLDVFGPKGNNGPEILVNAGTAYGPGVVNGTNQPLIDPGPDNLVGNADDMGMTTLLNGTIVPEGFLVQPHGSADGTLTEDDVRRIIFQGVQEALITRAAIRLKGPGFTDAFAVMMLTVTDKSGEILGQFRMPDSTIFSIDVSTAKARNVAYYADPNALQPIDQVPGVPAGVAFTARTFRFVALPRFPEGIDGAPPGQFSQLLDDPGIDRSIPYQVFHPRQPQEKVQDVLGTGLQIGPPQPASRFISVLGFNSFHPGTNFRDLRTNGVFDPNDPAFFQNNLLNRDGIVFFPGSLPLFKDLNGDGVVELVGGVGISGDGVDQDDVVTAQAATGYEVPAPLRADFFFYNGVRLPFQKFNRQPNINPYGSDILGSPLERRF